LTLLSLFRTASSAVTSRFIGLELDPANAETPQDASLGGRYCRNLTAEPDDEMLVLAWNELERNMTIVPTGRTKLTAPVPEIERTLDAGGGSGAEVPVDAFYVDRCATSNDEFARFVDEGCYRQPELWVPEALAHLLQFVDRTGNPGPNFWSNCRPPKGQGNHPVVGVCWYEALAFARWSGKQLLSPAQWQWAGVWASAGSAPAATKYPWGSAFDHQRANTWSSGIGDTVPVDEYYAGSTPNGVYQLVGNVWEWVSGSFSNNDVGGHEQLAFEKPPGEIRGGAFDTYLETQASCLFRSCQPRLRRGNNVGFRCCIPVAGLPTPPDPAVFM